MISSLLHKTHYILSKSKGKKISVLYAEHIFSTVKDAFMVRLTHVVDNRELMEICDKWTQKTYMSLLKCAKAVHTHGIEA